MLKNVDFFEHVKIAFLHHFTCYHNIITLSSKSLLYGIDLNVYIWFNFLISYGCEHLFFVFMLLCTILKKLTEKKDK